MNATGDVNIAKFARSDMYYNIKCPKCSKRFNNNEGLALHLKCLHSDDDSACSSSILFSKSGKAIDFEAQACRN